VHEDVTYVAGSTDDKHRMDVYLPTGKTGFPIVHFVHGGYWHTGDRRYYSWICPASKILEINFCAHQRSDAGRRRSRRAPIRPK